MPISPSQGQWIPIRDRYHSPLYVQVYVCVHAWMTKRPKRKFDFDSFPQSRICSCGFIFAVLFYLPSSYVSMASGFLLFPVHRSLIKPSNEEVMHNFICSTGTWGHFLISLKSMMVSFWKAIILLSAAGAEVTDAKWAIYRFLVERAYCVESFQTSYWGNLTPRGFICSRWYIE